jgi:hypothetical protein
MEIFRMLMCAHENCTESFERAVFSICLNFRCSSSSGGGGGGGGGSSSSGSTSRSN